MKEHTKRSEPNTAVNVFRYRVCIKVSITVAEFNAACTVDEAVCNK